MPATSHRDIQPAFKAVDELLVATVAGLAGEASGANPTGAVQRRSLPAMRFGGALPGAETTAPSQYAPSIAPIERFIELSGTELELRGVEPSALRRVLMCVAGSRREERMPLRVN